MGIFKAFLGDTYIKGETMTPKLRANLKNVKLFLGDKLRYQMPISGATTTCSTATYNGSTQTAKNISVVLSGETLTNATDYTVTSNSGGVNAGSYSYTVSGINYFNSSVNGTFKINPKTVSSPTITLSQTSYTYNGSQCKPTPTVKDGSTTIPNSEYTVSYSNNTNVGTATCTITDKSGGNYTVSGSKTFTINCYSATAPTAKSLTYNTSAQTLVNAGSTDFGTMVYSTTSGGTFSETIPTGTNAGSYEVWWKVTGNTNVCNTAATKISVTISPKTVSSPTITLSQNEYTYANTAFQPTPTVKDGSTTIASSEYTVSYSNNTNVGTATCTITDKSGGNYTVSGSKTFTINCYSATAPTAKSLNWTGSAQALVNAGSTAYGTMVYSTTSSGTFNTTIPTGTNAGDYEVWWKVTGNTNVCNTAATKVACTIKKVAMTYVAPSAATRTYTGSAQQIVSGASATGGAIYYATSSAGANSATTIPTQTAAGTYSTYWRAVPDGNHSGGTSWAQITGCVINKANPTYTAPTANNKTYNGSEIALLNAGSTSHGEIKYSTTSGGTYSASIPTQTNAGTYTTWWKLIGDSNHNDVTATSISTTISKAAGSVTTAPTKKTLTYNNTDQALVNAGSGTGTMLYKVGSGSWGTSIPTGKAAGDYTVYYKASASTNYNESASGSVACSIAKVTPTVTTPKPCGLTYNGNAQNLVSGGSTNWGTLQYSLDNSTWGTNIPQGTNATSYTVYYKVVGNSNINDVAAQSVSVTIAKANPTYTAPTKKTGLVYNGSAQNLLNAGSTSHGTIQYSSDNSTWSTTIPQGTNASSTYKAYWRLVGDSNHKDVASTEISSISIAKVTPTVTAPTPKTLTFNNTNQTLANAGSTDFGTIQYCLNNSGGTYSNSVPSASAANTTYKVWYKVVGNSNINDVAPASIDCMIAEKRVTTPTITLDPSSYTYNGTARQPSVTVKDGTTVIPSSEYNVGYSNNTNAGTATVTITDKDAGNYYISGTTTFTISKVTPTVTAPKATTYTYNNTQRDLVSGGSTNWGSLQYSTTSGGTYSTTIPKGTTAGSYEVWYKVVGDSNINSTDPTKVSCSIAKATGTATIAGTTNTYNNTAKNLISVSNNTGTMHYKVDSGGWSTTLPQATNAGSWTIYYYMDASTNYTARGSSGSPWGNVTSTINKVTPTVTAPTKKSLTYNGSAQALYNAGSTNWGTIQYCATSGGTYSTSMITATAAGSYDCWYKVVGNSNINDVEPAKVTGTTIAVLAGSISYATTAVTKTYGNAAFTNSLTKTGDGTVTYSSNNTAVATVASDGKVTIKQAGSATITATVANTSNTTYATKTASYTLTVNKANGSVSTAPTAKSLTWTGSAQALVNAGSGTGTMMYKLDSGSWGTSIPSATNATSYTVYYKASASTNYNESASGSVTCSIAKKTGCAISFATTSVSKTYGNAAFTNAITNTGDGSLTWGSSNTTIATVNTSGKVTIKQAGSCTISATTTSTTNCTYSTTAASYSLSVAKAAGSVKTAPTAKNPNWTGSAQALVNAGASDTGTMLYKLGSGSWGTSIPTATNAGSYTVYYKASASTNYEESTSGSVSCSIKQVAMTYTAPSATTYTYANTARNAASGGSANGGSIQYSTSQTGTYSTTIPTNTNAGSYDVWWKAVPDGNHSGGTSAAKLTATINCYTATAPTNKNPNWTGSAIAYANAGSTSYGTMVYCNTSGGTFSASLPTATNAGSYECWWKVTGNTNVCNTAATKVACTIAKVAMTYTAPSGTTYTYANTARNAASGGSANGGSIQYCTTSGGTYSTTMLTNTNAGSYDFWWKAVPDGNHSGGTSAAKLTATINKYTPTAPKAASRTWTGSAQELVSGGSTSYGTMVYSTDNSTWSTTVPQGTAAGSYTVYWKVSGNTNVNNTASTSISCSIAKKTGCAISFATTSVSKTYGNAAFTNAITNTGDGSLTWGSSNTTIATVNTSGKVTIKQAGSCTISTTTTSTTNCTYSTTAASYTLTVAKANITPTVSISNWNYGGTASNPSVAGNSGSGTVVYYYKLTSASSWSTTKPSAAGNYDIKAEISATTNYNSGSCTSTFTINKVAMTYTAPSAATRTYNSSAQQIVSGQSAGGGSIYYATSSAGASSSTTVPTQTNIGTYSTYWKAVPDSNHSGGTSSWTQITNCKINCYTASAPTNKNPNWTGNAQAYANAGSTAYGTMVYCNTSGGTFSTSLPTATNAGSYECWWKVTGNTNVCNTAATKVACTIAKVAMTYTAPSAATRTYTGSAQQIVSGGSANGGSIYYATSSAGASSSTTVPTQTNADSYTVYWKAVPDGNHSGGTSSWASISCSIAKASQSAPTATVTAATYPNTSSASASGGGGKGSIEWSNGSSRSAIGSQTTKARWSGNDNYNASPYSSEVTLSVAKFTPTVTLTATNRAYNGNALYATASVATPSGGKTMKGTIYYGTSSGAQTYSVTYTGGSVNLSSVSVTNVGSATVYAYFVPDSTCNDVYNNSGNASKTFSVSKANQSAPTATGATTTYHNTATATASGGGGQGTLTWTNGNTRTATGSQDTYAYWAGNSNYNASPNSNKVTLTVNKATDQSVTVTLTNRTYNTSSQVVASATSHGCTYYLGFGSSSTSAPSSWGSANSSISQTNAGTYYVWYKGTADANHSADISATYKGTVTIGKADQSAPTATGATSTYPTGATATASGGGGQGTLTWTNGSSRSSCGSQTTKAYWAGNSNYNASPNSNEVTITVNKGACPSYTAPTAKTGLVYNGSSQTLYNAGSSSNGTFSYSNGTRTAAGSQTVSWTFTPTDSCLNGASGSFSVTIAQKAISIPSPAGVSRAYNGSAASATFGSATGAGITKYRYSTNGTSWTESSTNPSQTNAGTLYTQAYYSANNDNYSGAGWSSSATIAISKASQSAPTATGATTTYNTTATATASGGGQQGSLEWSNGNTQTSVGSKTTKARWSGNNNYNASDWSNEVTVKMNKASQNAPTATGATVCYGNTATATASGGGGVGTLTWTNGNTRTAVGSQITAAYWAGNSNYNASLNSNDVILRVTATWCSGTTWSNNLTWPSA